jgi:hypothetical protein
VKKQELGSDSDEEEEYEAKMVNYFFSKLDYFGSNEHTFETETKLDLF